MNSSVTREFCSELVLRVQNLWRNQILYPRPAQLTVEVTIYVGDCINLWIRIDALGMYNAANILEDNLSYLDSSILMPFGHVVHTNILENKTCEAV